jgi:hypothetical protein
VPDDQCEGEGDEHVRVELVITVVVLNDEAERGLVASEPGEVAGRWRQTRAMMQSIDDEPADVLTVSPATMEASVTNRKPPTVGASAGE